MPLRGVQPDDDHGQEILGYDPVNAIPAVPKIVNTTVDPVTGVEYGDVTFDGSKGSPAYIFKEVKNVSVVAGTGLSVWTPSAGKKFRLLGWDLAPVTAASQAGIQFQDTVTYNTSNEFLRVPRFLSVNWSPTPRRIGPKGYLSSAANNQLWIDVSTTTNIEGYVYGIEE